MSHVVGILGGMGPEATSDLFSKIIGFTDAKRDQDHIKIIVENNVSIPDRTSFILGRGENPLKYLIKSALRLELMGADLIAMPCNTAHYFYDDIVNLLDVTFVNMIDEVGKYILQSYGENSRAGLLATKGVYSTEIYKNTCSRYGVEIVNPSVENQDEVLNLIYSIKKGNKDISLPSIYSILDEFKKQDISTIILGCTELPLIFNNLDMDDFNFIDSTAVLAKKLVELSKLDEIGLDKDSNLYVG